MTPDDTATNLLANVFHICRVSFYYLSFYSFLSEILENWFYNEQQIGIQEPETGNSSVLTFESFCREYNRMLSCLQIPGFPDRKRFGGGTLKNFHYDWVALTLWKSEQWQFSLLSPAVSGYWLLRLWYKHLKMLPHPLMENWKKATMRKILPCSLCCSPTCPRW